MNPSIDKTIDSDLCNEANKLIKEKLNNINLSVTSQHTFSWHDEFIESLNILESSLSNFDNAALQNSSDSGAIWQASKLDTNIDDLHNKVKHDFIEFCKADSNEFNLTSAKQYMSQLLKLFSDSFLYLTENLQSFQNLPCETKSLIFENYIESYIFEFSRKDEKFDIDFYEKTTEMFFELMVSINPFTISKKSAIDNDSSIKILKLNDVDATAFAKLKNKAAEIKYPDVHQETSKAELIVKEWLNQAFRNNHQLTKFRSKQKMDFLAFYKQSIMSNVDIQAELRSKDKNNTASIIPLGITGILRQYAKGFIPTFISEFRDLTNNSEEYKKLKASQKAELFKAYFNCLMFDLNDELDEITCLDIDVSNKILDSFNNELAQKAEAFAKEEIRIIAGIEAEKSKDSIQRWLLLVSVDEQIINGLNKPCFNDFWKTQENTQKSIDQEQKNQNKAAIEKEFNSQFKSSQKIITRAKNASQPKIKEWLDQNVFKIIANDFTKEDCFKSFANTYNLDEQTYAINLLDETKQDNPLDTAQRRRNREVVSNEFEMQFNAKQKIANDARVKSIGSIVEWLSSDENVEFDIFAKNYGPCKQPSEEATPDNNYELEKAAIEKEFNVQYEFRNTYKAAISTNLDNNVNSIINDDNRLTAEAFVLSYQPLDASDVNYCVKKSAVMQEFQKQLTARKEIVNSIRENSIVPIVKWLSSDKNVNFDDFARNYGPYKQPSEEAIPNNTSELEKAAVKKEFTVQCEFRDTYKTAIANYLDAESSFELIINRVAGSCFNNFMPKYLGLDGSDTNYQVKKEAIEVEFEKQFNVKKEIAKKAGIDSPAKIQAWLKENIDKVMADGAEAKHFVEGFISNLSPLEQVVVKNEFIAQFDDNQHKARASLLNRASLIDGVLSKTNENMFIEKTTEALFEQAKKNNWQVLAPTCKIKLPSSEFRTPTVESECTDESRKLAIKNRYYTEESRKLAIKNQFTDDFIKLAIKNEFTKRCIAKAAKPKAESAAMKLKKTLEDRNSGLNGLRNIKQIEKIVKRISGNIDNIMPGDLAVIDNMVPSIVQKQELAQSIKDILFYAREYRYPLDNKAKEEVKQAMMDRLKEIEAKTGNNNNTADPLNKLKIEIENFFDNRQFYNADKASEFIEYLNTSVSGLDFSLYTELNSSQNDGMDKNDIKPILELRKNFKLPPLLESQRDNLLGSIQMIKNHADETYRAQADPDGLYWKAKKKGEPMELNIKNLAEHENDPDGKIKSAVVKTYSAYQAASTLTKELEKKTNAYYTDGRCFDNAAKATFKNELINNLTLKGAENNPVAQNAVDGASDPLTQIAEQRGAKGVLLDLIIKVGSLFADEKSVKASLNQFSFFKTKTLEKVDAVVDAVKENLQELSEEIDASFSFGA